MKKILLILLSLILFPTFGQADCPDKIAHCKEGGVTLVNQKWNWKKAKCMPCEENCGSTLTAAKQFCADKGGIDEIEDIKKRVKFEKEDMARHQKLEEEKRKIQQEDPIYQSKFQKYKEVYDREELACIYRLGGEYDRNSPIVEAQCRDYADKIAKHESGLE